MAHTSKSSMTERPTIAVFADAQNVNLFKHSSVILEFISRFGDNPYARAYHHWRNISLKKEQKLFFENWHCVDVPDGNRNALDYRLMKDFKHFCRFCKPDILVLVANDGDFSPMVSAYLKTGRKVIVIGYRGKVSRKLMRLLPSDTYFIEDLTRQLPSAA
jgi:hypothetical protein